MTGWKKCRKKPIVVEFREVEGEEEAIHTLEGTLFAHADQDVIIKGVRGEIYPCKKEIFDEMYDVDGIRSSLEYVRKYDCAVCGKPVTARQVINGWIIECDCGELHRSTLTITSLSPWKLKEGFQND